MTTHTDPWRRYDDDAPLFDIDLDGDRYVFQLELNDETTVAWAARDAAWPNDEAMRDRIQDMLTAMAIPQSVWDRAADAWRERVERGEFA